MTNVGIESFALASPSRVLALDDLAALRKVNPAKYRIGLGCDEMALCDIDEDVATLAVDAARRAVEQWGGDPSEIGLLVVGTETAKDMSRPLSAWVAEQLGLRGSFRSYEVKHACYGGTAAVRQATEWIASGAARKKVALVVAADVALYAPGDPGEPTQGAGAAAMILSDNPTIADIEIDSYPFSLPAFDFWRPVGESFPRVDGKFSLQCYKDAAEACFADWMAAEGGRALPSLDAVCLHCPFPKMVKKGFFHMAQALGVHDADAVFRDRVEPHMAWNRRTGNSYTASVWWALGHALTQHDDGARLGVFSYGSGAGAELMFVRVRDGLDATWAQDVESRLDGRSRLDAAGYDEQRVATAKAA